MKNYMTYLILMGHLIGNWGILGWPLDQTCPYPPKIPNAHLLQLYSNMREFPELVKVYYACNKGYRHAQGDNVIACIQSTWQKPNLVCRFFLGTCPYPPEIPNARLLPLYTKMTEFPELVKVFYACNKNCKHEQGDNFIACIRSAWQLPTMVCKCVTPAIITRKYEVTALQRSAVLLPCYFRVDSETLDMNHLMVQWEFQGKNVTMFMDNVLYSSGSTKVSVNELKKGNASLVLTSISPANEGKYSCIVRYFSDIKQNATTILTIDDGALLMITEGPSITDHEELTVLLPCYFSTDSETLDLNLLTVYWKFQGNDVARFAHNILFNSRRVWLSVNELNKGNASLILTNVSPTDEGDYVCEISYMPHIKLNMTATLNIDDGTPNIIARGSLVTANQGSVVLLPCYFNMDSETMDLNHLVVQWEFQGSHVARFEDNILYNSTRAWLSVDELERGNASLALGNILPKDEGDYVCDVSYFSNINLKVIATLNIEDDAVTMTTPGLNLPDQQESMVLLPCYFSADSETVDLNLLTVQWEYQGNLLARFVNKILFNNSRAWLSVDGLKKGNASLILKTVSTADEGDYVCYISYLPDIRQNMTTTLSIDDGKPKVIAHRSLVTASQGSVVLLPCYFNMDSETMDLNHLVVQWEFQGSHVARFQENILYNSTRAWLSMDELEKGNASLVLGNISPEDEGDYVCHASYFSILNLKVIATLNIEDDAVTMTTPGLNLPVQQESMVLLPCYFTADSETLDLNLLTVQWEFQGNHLAIFADNILFNSSRAWLSLEGLKKGNASLILKTVSTADEGDYMCYINYLPDIQQNMTTALNIYDGTPKVVARGFLVTANQGSVVLLPCYFNIDSETMDLNHLVVQWEFQGSQVAKFLNNNVYDSRRARLSATELEKGNASLVINNISLRDEGNYTCDISYFSDIKLKVIVTLNIKDDAVIMTTLGPSLTDKQESMVLLPCYFSADSETLDLNLLTVQWEFQGNRLAIFADKILFNSSRAWLSMDGLKKGNASLILKTVSAADEGDYVCYISYLPDIRQNMTTTLNIDDGTPKVVARGSLVTANQGSVILLPCYFNMDSETMDLNHLVVQWEFQGSQVAKFMNNNVYDSKRARLSVTELEKGNASLVINNISFRNEGNYTCNVSYFSDTKLKVIVTLNIEDDAVTMTTLSPSLTDKQESIVLLPCYFSTDSETVDLNLLTVQWEFQGSHLARFADKILFNSSRAWLSVDGLEKGNASLILNTVSTADEGDYMCYISYLPDIRQNMTTTLNIYDGTPNIIARGSLVTANQGSVVLLPCYFNMDLETMDLNHLVVQWEFQGSQVAKFMDNNVHNSRTAWLSATELEKGNASLVINNISLRDEGNYTCDVNYFSDISLKVIVALNIEDDAVTMTTLGPSLTDQQESMVHLPCYFRTESETVDLNLLTVQWEFQGNRLAIFADKILFNSSRAWLSVDELKKGNASLILKTVSTADEGDYECYISYLPDIRQNMTTTLNIDDGIPVVIVPGFQVTETRGSNVLLPCHFMADSNSVDLNNLVVQWKFQGYHVARFEDNILYNSTKAWLSVDELGKGNASLLLNNISPEDEGDYTCEINYFSDFILKAMVTLNTEDGALTMATLTPSLIDQKGSMLLLPCYFSTDSETLDLNLLTVQWVFQGNHVARFANNVLNNSKKAWLSPDELKKGNVSLVIANVLPEDEGEYTCDIGYLPDIRLNATATVIIDDGIPKVMLPESNVTGNAGSTVLLPCYFLMDSKTVDLNHLVVQWEFQGSHVARFEDNILYNSTRAWLSVGELERGNASLELGNISPEDEGDYVCDVSYFSNINLKVTATLNIEGCAMLPPILNGEAEYTDDTRLGSVVNFYCHEGHTIVGRNYTTCLPDGWDHQNPQCVPITCENPPSITDGEYELEVHSQDIEAGTIATYNCIKGHLTGEKSIVCNSSGIWSGPPPSCKVECDKPPPLENANADVNSRTTFPIGSKVNYKCRPGYTGLPFQSTCTQSVKWTKPRIICRPKSCGVLPDLENGRIEYENDTTFGSVAHFFCNEGYNIIGRNYRTCLVKGWDYQNPECAL
ncbi:basement membrane-specific heparan sulfate proteoglycan core protein-like isoform X2 [Protopterus annectens]|uniref:basement membrane-specific heparan sulfate proteoglycan core protein-like isoform X2 n=1 Tax=Protopterus annectens TaxID=7888 RepID=UPI001CFBF68D|nr:basement membrane-specific heparan sulfate proteoglycan core protein-like isoform X2 [Protopterus annectens]